MSRVRAGCKEFDASLFVFDKDGLLFQSRQFWKELANARAKVLQNYVAQNLVERWLRLMNVAFEKEENGYRIMDVDPAGILAVASPSEEITVTAGFLSETKGQCWTEARNAAREIFRRSDEEFCLKNALTPRKGFPEIFHRLRKAGIPYGIATSDDYNRAVQSVDLFDTAKALSFIVTPLEVKKGKPDPEMLHLIAQKTGIPTTKMVMVGDSYVDVEMASAAGAFGIGVPETQEMAERMKPFASAVVKDLDEITILCEEEG